MAEILSNVNGSDTYALQAALGAYSDEAYTNARKLSGTGIVGPNPNIDTKTETFIGQVRWFKPITAIVNTVSLDNSGNGTGSTYTSDFSTYVKTVRSHGATNVNMSQVVTQQDGLAKISRDFGETRAQNEHDQILAVLKGVAASEALLGLRAGGLGGQTFDNDPASTNHGFYVDLGAGVAPIGAASASSQGAQRAENFLRAIGMAWKDYEPDYAYLIVSPETLASLRSANLVDETKVTEANVKFDTIFGGKFRLIQTRAAQGFTTAQLAKLNNGASAGIGGTKTSFIVLPGALAMENLDVPSPVEIYRDARAYNGGGSTDIWYRWGNVVHPGGYDWAGATTKFPTNADYMAVKEGASYVAIESLTSADASAGVWTRKASSALSLGILPIFHA